MGTAGAEPSDYQAPKVTAEEVAQYADQHQAEWVSKAPAGQSRLFYTPEEWKTVLARIDQATGEDAKWKKQIFEEADQICASPIQPYHPPPAGSTQGLEEGWERTFGDEMVVLALAAKIVPHTKYEERMHDMVLEACTFETWGRQGTHGELSNMDLSAGSITKGIAISYDWHRDAFTDAEKDSIRKVMAERVHALLLGLYGGIFWSNWYSQNHNHVAVSGLGLSGLAFLGEIPEASQWLAGAMLNFQRAAQSMASDGSSYEGVAYWGYGRAYLIQFIEGTKEVTGADAFYDAASLKNAAQFRIGSSTPDLRGILMWADSRGFDVDGPQQILYRLASQYHDGQAQYLADNLPFFPAGDSNAGWSLLWRDPSVQPVAPTELDYFFPSWNVVSSRSGWGAGDYVLSLKAGQTNDHHTHLDVGSVIFYMGGDWLMMAPGYGLGLGSPGFFDQSGKRFDFFSNATESESTLLINGQNQRTDDQSRGTIDHYVSAPSAMWTEVDLSQAYHDVKTVRRGVFHHRGKYALVLDSVTADQPVTVDWLAQVPPRATHDGSKAVIEGGGGNLSIEMLGNGAPFEVRKPTRPTVDVLPKRLMTLASEKKGNEVHFETILQPQYLHQTPVSLKTSSTDDKDGRHISIGSGDWQDDITVPLTSGKLSVPGFNSGPAGAAVARFLAVGQTTGKITSVMVGSASHAQIGPIVLEADQPIDFSLEKTEANFVFDLGTSFSGTLSLASGLTLFGENGAPVSFSKNEKMSLPKGRYFIVRDAAKIAEVMQWPAHLFPGRPDPRTYPAAVTTNLSPAPSSSSVKWEAENSPLERYDYASVRDESKALGGKGLMGFGIDSSSDSVGWKINVPASGTYFLKMRYSTTQNLISFNLLVDGALPTPMARGARVPGIKGAPREKYFVPTSFGWMEHYLTAGDGDVPLPIPLTAGDHEIRLADPTQPINLDAFELTPATPEEKAP